MVSISASLSLALLVYFIIRIEILDDVWPETSEYERKIEGLLATYLWGIFDPFNEEVSSTVESMMSSVDEQFDGGLFNLDEDAEPDDLDGLDWEDFLSGTPAEFMGTLRDSFEGSSLPALNDGEADQDDIAPNGGETTVETDDLYGVENPAPAQFLVEEGHLDPSEIFEEVKALYIRYRRPQRALLVARVALSILIALSGIMLYTTLFNFQLPSEFTILYSGVLIVWLSSELALWYALDKEVATEGKTPFGKFLEPDPRDFF